MARGLFSAERRSSELIDLMALLKKSVAQKQEKPKRRPARKAQRRAA
jgi:non-homologous end joining protein Ku